MKPLIGWCLVMTAINVWVAAVVGFADPMTTYHAGSPGSAWRLFSTHFSHLDMQHLVSNLAALYLLNVLFPVNIRSLIMAYLMCITITAWYVTTQDIEVFLGFSALLYCHPGCYLIQCLRRQKWLEALVIVTILLSYLGFQVLANQFSQQHWLSMPAAHMLGFLSGTLAALCHLMYHENDDREEPVHNLNDVPDVVVNDSNHTGSGRGHTRSTELVCNQPGGQCPDPADSASPQTTTISTQLSPQTQ